VVLGLGGLILFIGQQYQIPEIDKVAYSLIAIAASYLIFRLVVEEAVVKNIRELKARYSFRKTTYLLFWAISLILILRIWVINPQALLVAYGLTAAGVAISISDVFKNLAGAMAIFMTGVYSVGDRIEINGNFGDVIDIGLFYTSLLEIEGWVKGDQPTGRISVIPNGLVLGNPTFNYTKDHHFIWDEMVLSISNDSDWQKATETILKIIKKETADETIQAQKEMSGMERKYFVTKRNFEPAVYISPDQSFIKVNVRYVVDSKDRRLLQDKLFKLILTALKKNKKIKIAG